MTKTQPKQSKKTELNPSIKKTIKKVVSKDRRYSNITRLPTQQQILGEKVRKEIDRLSALKPLFEGLEKIPRKETILIEEPKVHRLTNVPEWVYGDKETFNQKMIERRQFESKMKKILTKMTEEPIVIEDDEEIRQASAQYERCKDLLDTKEDKQAKDRAARIVKRDAIQNQIKLEAEEKKKKQLELREKRKREYDDSRVYYQQYEDKYSVGGSIKYRKMMHPVPIQQPKLTVVTTIQPKSSVYHVTKPIVKELTKKEIAKKKAEAIKRGQETRRKKAEEAKMDVKL